MLRNPFNLKDLLWVAIAGATLSMACAVSGCASEEAASPPAAAPEISPAVVGKLLYFDTNLSNPPGQSCASCHAPDNGFAEPHGQLPVSQGANSHLCGNRNSPSVAYAAYSPEFYFDATEKMYVGGQFWDGRAKNLVDQAKGPFLNPVEMAMPSKAAVVAAVKASAYADLFEFVYGAAVWGDVDKAYDKIAEAIAAYEASAEVNRFSSKFDLYLAGKAQLTAGELRGLALFKDPAKGNCAACHPATVSPDGTPPLFTDFTYDNLGVPKNAGNPFYSMPAVYNPEGMNLVDHGLGGVLKDMKEEGKFKVPTLRNVALTAPYMHNGLFNTLEAVVEFYNSRDVGKPDGGTWDPPEISANVNSEEMGNLKLSADEVKDISDFMRTLTDGFAPAP